MADIKAERNPIEERIKALEAQVSDVNDLEILNKLDIINLKNEIEKLKMGFGPAGAPPEEQPKKVSKKEPQKEKPKKKETPKGPEIRTCPKCGAVVPSRAKYCGKCGAKL